MLLVRSERDPEEIAKALESTLHGLDSGLPIAVRTWNQEMSSALFAARVATVALGVLGLLGAVLAVTGIFGMASYTVSKASRQNKLTILSVSDLISHARSSSSRAGRSEVSFTVAVNG
jgi:hypothetical protein